MYYYYYKFEKYMVACEKLTRGIQIFPIFEF